MGSPPTLRLLRRTLSEVTGGASFAYLAKARELSAKGFDVINFGIGQPDFPTPRCAIEEAKRALDEGFTRYTQTEGIPELREAVAEYLNERYGCDVRREEVVVAPGAKGAIMLAMMAFLEPGDEVVIIEPSFYTFPELARLLGARPVFVPLKWLGPDKGFALDVEAVERAITPRTKMVVVNNPHNPTGTVLSPREVEELAEVAKRRGVLLLVDEVYDSFVYDAQFKSFLSLPDWRDYVLYVGGVSKTFSMTGWRVGYLVARREVAAQMRKISANTYSCATSFAQRGAVAALREGWREVEKIIKEEYRRRRDVMVEELRKVPGFEVAVPQGAFYVFPRVRRLLDEVGMNVDALAEHLLYEAKVVALPGTSFPDKAGRDFMRFSYALSAERIREGVARVREAVEKLLQERARR